MNTPIWPFMMASPVAQTSLDGEDVHFWLGITWNDEEHRSEAQVAVNTMVLNQRLTCCATFDRSRSNLSA